ncbi:hypothetical protein MGG_16397 [Pyricularia oryzae 70-15]|uniref:Uncharacterized protein n=3 Tax=Pyricularia oryzae TaxID=318829 RepID=G4MMN0_PYRO7|nr:uncharacterized protein MGG_16397 [Pyricularia oryzae 70-15]EHA57802.1 hypothetical protein MGG_16397 [Pyricularia oryzae 70-15]ELQ34057.1 hypothetical protein OOU_Y34scaffold00810g3 [Pyricularia oryzae Y34]
MGGKKATRRARLHFGESSDWPVNQRGYGRTAGGQAASCHGSVIWVVARRRPSEGAAFCGIGNPVEATRAGILL